MKRGITIHLWGEGMKEYLGNIVQTNTMPFIGEEDIKELLENHPDKDKVKFVTIEVSYQIES